MSDPRQSNVGEKDVGAGETLARYEGDGKLHVEHVQPDPAQRGLSITADPHRNASVATSSGRQHSTGGARRLSEWDAMKIAKEGGVEIDEEIEMLEEELRNNPIKTGFFSPTITFNDPRHFTYV